MRHKPIQLKAIHLDGYRPFTNFRSVANACPQNFKPFVEFLEAV